MRNVLFIDFNNWLKEISDKEYLLHLLEYHISPTLAGIKPATLLTLGMGGRGLKNLWDLYKRDFINYIGKIEFREVKKSNYGTQVLFFDRADLEQIIHNRDNLNFLKGFGYEADMDLEQCLEHMRNRFNDKFPHEIGLFLGIPLYDVICFIEHPEKNYIINGYWRVYSNPKEAKRKFQSFDMEKEKIINKFLN